MIVWTVSKLQYCIKIEGRENLEKGKQYLYTANHTSYLDPPFVSLAANETVAYMAKQELFTDKNWLLRFVVKILGGFAVNREKPELATFKTVFDIRKNTKWSLGIFPEGQIRRTGVIENIQRGFITIAKKAKLDIVPIGIRDLTAMLEKHCSKNILKRLWVNQSLTNYRKMRFCKNGQDRFVNIQDMKTKPALQPTMQTGT